MTQQEPPAAPTRCNKRRRLLISYASTDTPGITVPYLRLRGRWLQDSGFVIGRHVTIEVNDARLMIEQVD